MLYAKFRDFQPRSEYKGYVLGWCDHDDGDVVKWDWTVYKFSELQQFETSPNTTATNEMYEEIKSLDISPYERNMSKIIDEFERIVDWIRSDEYWHEGPLFS